MTAEDLTKWKDEVVALLKGDEPLKVKKLRKQVLLSLQSGEDDKAAKKTFKHAVQALEADGEVKLDADGKITLNKRKSKDEKKTKKKKRRVESAETNEEGLTSVDRKPRDSSQEDRNAPRKDNPQGATRLFLGNLPFAVDEKSLEEFIPGVTHIKWITDKETGKFYGSAFIEMDNSKSAAAAVAKSGSKLMDRPVKINFAPARPGDKWPPEREVISGNSQAGGSGIRAMSDKPENCTKLFIGNLSYDIDDDGITKFFANADAEVKAIRWIHHKDSGDFKGVGFVEFWNTEACERGAALNGKNLLGRPIRIDWTD